jgi:hypothetical protein
VSDDLQKDYEDGLTGYVPNMREKMEFLDTQRYQYFSEPNIKGSGLGKRALLWHYAKKLDKRSFTEKQTTGDCFVAGTLVRMGDGTEKPIEAVSVGDVVMSPFGSKRAVLGTIKKQNSKPLRIVRAANSMRVVFCTPDHLFVTGFDEGPVWKAASDISRADCVFYEGALWVVGTNDEVYARDCDVYCIEVEVDHAFIANGYAVHNCVSHATRNSRDITRAIQILVNRQPEDWFQLGATEPTYGARGHGGQGMSPGRAARFERDVGFLARTDYGVVNLTTYNSRIGTNWGPRGVPKEVQELCSKNKVGVISNVRTQEDLMDAMFNGYCASSGQNASWSVDSNSKGIHYRTPRGWAHMMAIGGYDDSREIFPFRVWMILNSWGRWNQKPKVWPKEYGEWEPGLILTSADDFNVCVDQGDCWVYGSIDGYPPQRLPDYGTIGLLSHE